MKFEEVLPALREGKKVRNSKWEDGGYISYSNNVFIDEEDAEYPVLWADDIVQGDWEIVKEPWKPKKGETYFFITATGIRRETWEGVPSEHRMYANHFVFKTKSEAKEASKKVKQLLKELKEDD